MGDTNFTIQQKIQPWKPNFFCMQTNTDTSGCN